MRIKYLFLVMLTMVTLSLSAQQYKQDYIITRGKGSGELPRVNMVYGVMAGANFAMLDERDGRLDISNRAGFAIGGMWGFDWGRVEVVPELWYMHNEADIMADKSYALSVNSFEVPIICAIELGGGVRFNLGPSFSMMSDATLEAEGEDDVEFGQVKSTLGYVVGVSATLWDHLIVDARFTGHFAAMKQEWYKGNEEYNYRYRTIGINVGYRF